jgi:hypothetical protein
MKTYIYTLSHPETKEIRYIGKTININRRFNYHCSKFENSKHKTHKSFWILSILNKGLKPIMQIIDETEEDWQKLETYYIEKYKNEGYNLCNLTTGGEGLSGLKRTEETKKKISLNNARARNKRVYQFALDGKFIEDYPSVVEASLKTNITHSRITSCARGKQFSSGGFYWSYIKKFKNKPPRKNSNKWKQLIQ